MQTKRALREHFREVRASIDADERVRADTAIALTLWGTEEYQNAGIIFSYVSFGQDVDTIATFVKAWEDGKRVAVPIFHPATHSMEFFEVNSIQDLHGTAELDNPGAGRLAATPDDICIVPGLGYDVQGHRLGTGGGYLYSALSAVAEKLGASHERVIESLIVAAGLGAIAFTHCDASGNSGCVGESGICCAMGSGAVTWLAGGDGLQAYAYDGREIIPVRGYDDSKLSPQEGASIFTRYTLEVRQPIIESASATIWLLGFLEGGNSWYNVRDFQPFNIYNSAGLGVRVFMPMFGLIGVDWGYGFDGTGIGGSHVHFSIGQSLD